MLNLNREIVVNPDLAALYESAKKAVYADVEKKPEPVRLSDEARKRLSENLAPCILHIVAKNPKSKRSNTFNRLSMGIATYSKFAGLSKATALDIAENFIENYPHSQTYTTPEARRAEFKSVWTHIQKTENYQFKCSFILGLGFPGNAFDCSKCLLKNEAGSGETHKESGSPLTFPLHIMTGAAGYFSEVLADCMEPPQHFFFTAYLTCLGAILSNKITLKTELRPQARLYLVILGESADDKKSTAISKTVDFFQNSITDFSVCFGVGSAEGLQRRFLKDPNVLLVYDELKAFIGKSKVDGSVLLPCACTLFESNRYESHTKNKEIVLSGAGLSILAASTIETYERCWDAAFQDIGMTNRLFIVPGQGKRQYAIPGQVPSHEWDIMKHDLGKVLRTASLTPELDITPGARALYEAWYLNLEQSVHTKRLDTYALRFLILLAVNALKSEVDEAIVQDVIDLMNWQLQARRLHDPIDADSAIAKIEEKIRRVLTTGPRSDRDLKRAVHYNRIGTWVFSNAIRNLTKSNEIHFNKSAKSWGLK